jgi:hypothetical protein
MTEAKLGIRLHGRPVVQFARMNGEIGRTRFHETVTGHCWGKGAARS